MALINCPECNNMVSDKSFQCPKCAYPINYNTNQNFSSQQFKKIENTTLTNQQNSINQLFVLTAKKSEGISFCLTFLFGPFGLIYANSKKAGGLIAFTIIAIFLAAILCSNSNDETSYYLIAEVICLISWIISIVLGLQEVGKYNKSMINSILENDILKSTIQPLDKSVILNNSETDSEENFDSIDQLKHLLNEQKHLPFYANSKRPEILDMVNGICDSKENTIRLLQQYQKRFKSNLVEDVKDISTSYENIRENVAKFIEFGLVQSQFPHAYIL